MSTNFTTKNVKFSGALKAYTEKQLKGIERISGEIISSEIIVSEEKFIFKVEINLKTKTHNYHAQYKNQILKQTLRKTLNILKAQAKKNKEKLKKEKKRTPPRRDFLLRKKSSVVKKSDSSRITLSNSFSKKPYSIEEAIFFLTEGRENTFMFINSETNKISVVFYNRNNEISIIEAN
jgi:putative sigma-54 modulation protein